MSDELITSPQNPRIKAVHRLRDGGRAERAELIVVDGRRELRRAIEAGVAIHELFYCLRRLRPADEADLLRPARAAQARLTEVSEPVLEKISYGERSDGIVAVAGRPRRLLADLRLGEHPLLAVLENVEKPGNVGAVLRSADAAGVAAVLVADAAADPFGPNAIRASLGTIFCVPVVETNGAEARAWLADRGLTAVAADPAAENIYTDVDFRGATAIVLGGEAQGLSDAWRGPGTRLARVPMRGRADSLNVSITAALFFYEALRQRTPLAG